MDKFRVILSLLLMLFAFPLIADESVLTMGYKDKAKMPLINVLGDNSGVYQALFSAAAKKAGKILKIVRQPKKRIHAGFKDGSLDFYPGASFSKKRAAYLYYIPNGLMTKEVLITQDSQAEITDMSQVKGRLIVESGSSKAEWDKQYPSLRIVQMTKLPIEIAVQALQSNRGDFYVADIEAVDFYQKWENLRSYKDIGLKVHHNAINKKFVPMYLGFSRKSSLFSEIVNPDYDESKGISIDNFPSIISKNSFAHRLMQSLNEMKESGETQAIYDKYFK